MMPNLNAEEKERFKKMYSKVVKKFPNIKNDEITLCFDPFVSYAEISLFDNIRIFHENEYVFDPKLSIGLSFFSKFNDKEREAVIAHELGHYDYRTRYRDLNRMKKVTKWVMDVNDYNMDVLKVKIISLFNKKKKHRIERLQGWYIMYELYADKKAAEAGYGKQMLAVLKKILPEYHRLPPIFQKEITARINHLERMLEK